MAKENKNLTNDSSKEPNEVVCAFCGRKHNDVKQKGINFSLSSLSNIAICDVCLDSLYEANSLIREHEMDFYDEEDAIDVGKMEDFYPKLIKSKLDEYVIGQEDAKRALSIAAYNHIKRVNNINSDIAKTNVLLVGPSGCGKTFLVDTLSKILNVPCVSVNITAYSATGYKGKDAIDILKSLYYAADENVALAERGIIFIDEVDKIASTGKDERSVGETKIQQSILKYVEGCEEDISDLSAFEPITINTKNILFIFAGAFVGIEKFQKGNAHSLGFTASSVSDKNKTLKKVTAENLISYGLIPEFVGRVQKIVTLRPLDKKDLIDILKTSKTSACVRYQNMLKLDGYDLTFEDEALEEIADTCIKTKLGARALSGVIEETMEDILFDAPTGKKIRGKRKPLVITKDMVLNRNSSMDVR